ncbi:kinase-like protein [Aspergillus indologenus CBS 114.80]|uniref:Kinase-like protein n=1 Tax=Aspergillus indologenus CBS 114.80 TaxID=1450541 RepID=A0A2V5J5U4_9EURO|nr:kinase-like protein [Aspergillus indologenus CBS 114.80]
MNKDATKDSDKSRLSTFPRTRTGQQILTKRVIANLEPSWDSKRHAKKLQKDLQEPSARLQKETADPWERYEKCFKLYQAGEGYLVFAKNATFKEAMMKKIEISGEDVVSNLTTASHKNLVQLYEVLYREGTLFLFYEVMDVSLNQVFATPLGRMRLYEVAAFSHDILLGLNYIHQIHRISHGNINSNNILLATNGSVKIANFGESILHSQDLELHQDDIRSIGTMIIECLEPQTSLQKEDCLRSKTWDPKLINFIEATKQRSAQYLLKDDFLQLSPGSPCLKPYIRLARELANNQVELQRD